MKLFSNDDNKPALGLSPEINGDRNPINFPLVSFNRQETGTIQERSSLRESSILSVLFRFAVNLYPTTDRLLIHLHLLNVARLTLRRAIFNLSIR